MEQNAERIFVGDTLVNACEKTVTGGFVSLLGEKYYQIQNYDAMPPFFMSIVSSSNHWLFISSSGGLSAGRVSAEQSLFPYYTEDKLTENSENTGCKAILLVRRDDRTYLWEPFSIRQQGQYDIQHNLYKNISGTAVVFEEINRTLELTYRYAWRTSERFGFVKTAWLSNGSDGICRVEMLDGLQNILPANIVSVTQNSFSCLLDAYKRSELQPETGLGIFSLNSTLTDLAEPSESLLASTVFQAGLEHVNYLISSRQLDRFRAGMGIVLETEVRGERCAYFVHAKVELAAGEETCWHLAADIGQDHAAIALLLHALQGNSRSLCQAIEQDIQSNITQLRRIVACADGWQISDDLLSTAHHFSSAMFNVMRGGIFANQYWIDKADFIDYVTIHNQQIVSANEDFFFALPEKFHVTDLHSRAEGQGSADLTRLSYTYLPLAFSRRHGDPSRPWNRFAINIKKVDGSQQLDYEGNWRDIFQNWEALAYSYPEFVEGMLFNFLSATTADGYNPYRITRAGIDWEAPEEGNPWANIGYWSDHQIIYLQKLMEISIKVHPGQLCSSLERPVLSYANVPYQIKPYADLKNDPYNTIVFDHSLEHRIKTLIERRGTDGKLVCGPDGQVLHCSLAEKLLTLLLAKLVNFVPEGGIWMNTQRPEWNDANNALVGKGLSVVTLGYLRRYIAFCRELFEASTQDTFSLSMEVYQFYAQVFKILSQFQPLLKVSIDDEQRGAILDALGEAGSDYRGNFYNYGFSTEKARLRTAELIDFLALTQRYVEHSLRANQRADNLYHSYNILHLDSGRASVGRLYEMLEGQVAILSSGLLSGSESLALLQSLRRSALYQANQNSYILYPDRQLPGFLGKNCLDTEQVRGINLLTALVETQDSSLITRDINGVYHFNGHLRNAHGVNRVLETLKRNPRYADLVNADGQRVKDLFGEIFCHDEFTGRSGTFFAYEGLGSVYWHMVSKLLLAVQETALRCQGEACAAHVSEAYYDIRAGLGFNKTPDAFGAFPTDPYSHTPKGAGARQPGMTGLVKEEILCRQVELGLTIENGSLVFNPLFLRRQELLTAPASFDYLDVSGDMQRLDLQAGSLAYTVCQTPLIVQAAHQAEIIIYFADGRVQTIAGNRLDECNSRHIFQRDGMIQYLLVKYTLSS